MKEIKLLVEHMEEEIEDAKEYAEEAMHYKAKNASLSTTFAELSAQELKHMEMLHTRAEEIITAYRKEHGEPPADMIAIYNYEHDKIIRKATEVRTMLEMIKK